MDSKEQIKQNSVILELLNQKIAFSQELISQETILYEAFVAYLNHLICYDFNKLVSILYRVDVSEQKVRKMLAESSQELAAETLAQLIIEREKEKEKYRNWYKNRSK